MIHPVDRDGVHLPALTLVGRSGPRADVDDLDLKSGRWAAKPGEIVLSASFGGPAVELGAILKTSDAADSPTLTIVGIALSASKTADTWATPEQVEALASADNPLTSQMLYRFTAAEQTARSPPPGPNSPPQCRPGRCWAASPISTPSAPPIRAPRRRSPS